MDFQRILILLGLAVTSYMLILAWNDDYKHNANTAPISIETPDFENSESNFIPQMDEADDSGSIVPAVEPDSIVQHPVAIANTDRIVKISTKNSILWYVWYCSYYFMHFYEYYHISNAKVT